MGRVISCCMVNTCIWPLATNNRDLWERYPYVHPPLAAIEDGEIKRKEVAADEICSSTMALG